MILITGASKGIGGYLFNEYLRMGHEVFGTYLSTAPQDNSGRLSQVDVSSYSNVENWFNVIKGRADGPITLVSCAAVNYNEMAHRSEPAKWEHVIHVNVVGVFNAIRCVLPTMRAQGSGTIINISSVVAQVPTIGVSAYATSKAALWGLTKSLAAENSAKGVTVNCINLGYANIGMGVHDVPAATQSLLKERIPTKRFCEPMEIFETVEFLRRNCYMTGTSIDLNGGLL